LNPRIESLLQNYREGSVEQAQVLRFLNARCIKERFETEEDYFGSDLTLAQWARDARQWATDMLNAEPEVCEELFHEAREKALDQTRIFYRQHLGSQPVYLHRIFESFLHVQCPNLGLQ
jgi:hypothetical protein